MNVKNFILICGGLLTLGHANGEAQVKNKNKAPAAIESGRLDNHISELMASRVTPAVVASDELAIARLEAFNDRFANEDDEFPADELYNSNWDTVHVNPFKNLSVDFPDTYTVDCRAFVMPLENNIKVTSKYGPRRRRMHRGIDLDLEKGDTIRAAFDGKVRIKSYERKGYGYYVVLRHANGLETVYGHLSKFLVGENQVVRAGAPLGLGGNTGNSRGTHLHFEIRFLGKDIDPAELIDFENGAPHKDEYVFHNVKINGKNSNMYASSPDALAVHRVMKGETLAAIAKKYQTTVSELCEINGVTKTSKLAIGQPIRFRAKQMTVEASSNAVKQTSANAAAVSASKTENKQVSSNKTNVNAKTIEAPVEKTANADKTVYHSIQSGDTLYSLSKKYGLTVEKLCELNNIKDNMILKVGSKIRCS